MLSGEEAQLTYTGARYELGTPDSSTTKCDTSQALSNIIMRLMQKYVLEDDKVGIQNPEVWEDSPIVSFLSSVMSGGKFQDLKGVSSLPTLNLSFQGCSNYAAPVSGANLAEEF